LVALSIFVSASFKTGKTAPATTKRAAGSRKVVPRAYTIYLGGGQPGHAQTVKAALAVTGTAAGLPQ
jgi:hypothetical protein